MRIHRRTSKQARRVLRRWCPLMITLHDDALEKECYLCFAPEPPKEGQAA